MGTLCTSGCRTTTLLAHAGFSGIRFASERRAALPGSGLRYHGHSPVCPAGHQTPACSTSTAMPIAQNVRWATYFCRSVYAGEMRMYGMMYEWPASASLSLSIGPELLNNLY